MVLYKIDHNDRLYVMKFSHGYSCYGFDVLDRKARAVLQWMGENEILHNPGSAEHFNQCNAILDRGDEYSRRTGKRCDAELVPALIGLEDKRIECEYFGEKRRFYVGKSIGWMPCHLEIKTRRSRDGCALIPDAIKNIRVIGSR